VSTADELSRERPEARERLKGVAEDLKRRGSEAGAGASGYVQGFADRRKSEAAGYLHEVAAAASSGGRSFAEAGCTRSADLLGRLAGEADEMAARVDRAGLRSLVADAEAFARRQPTLVVVGALLTGFLAVRFLKSGMDAEKAREATQEAGEYRPGHGQPPGGGGEARPTAAGNRGGTPSEPTFTPPGMPGPGSPAPGRPGERVPGVDPTKPTGSRAGSV